jgi:hypothetical protein
MEMFHLLTAKQMKEVLGEAGVPAVRLPGHTSTRKRNEDWANRLWRALPTGNEKVGNTLLYKWLSQRRSEMLCAFLDALGVPHQNGLTEDDFWQAASDEAVRAAADRLLSDARFDRREVAAYLLFLDQQHKTERLTPLDLPQYLREPPVAS